MLAHQWPEATRKRLRDEEAEASNATNGQLGFTEHRNKRLHATSIQSILPTRRRSAPSNFPHQDDTAANSNSVSEHVRTEQPSEMTDMDLDQDVDMTVDHLDSPEVLQPNQTPSNGTGRIPTPIHCSFAVQVRGNHWGAVPSTDNNADTTSTLPNGKPIAPGQLYPPQDSSAPLSYEGAAAEWSLVQNRRLPSPICEMGGEDTGASPGMVLDGCPPHSSNAQTLPLHPNIQLSPQPADADAAMGDIEGGSGSPSSAPATPSSRSKYGHCRSKHTINTWTLQPGMKKSFSIGYRADCEKCRMKIPGHFNHIIIS
ncbi:hypothetical protein GGR50DRAFT_419477 [Xylaria sp. CBS 124048]|nr:hypothetical protein GGR50DRAFT_419477 [Xylaria sp. CBS 124048]